MQTAVKNMRKNLVLSAESAIFVVPNSFVLKRHAVAIYWRRPLWQCFFSAGSLATLQRGFRFLCIHTNKFLSYAKLRQEFATDAECVRCERTAYETGTVYLRVENALPPRPRESTIFRIYRTLSSYYRRRTLGFIRRKPRARSNYRPIHGASSVHGDRSGCHCLYGDVVAIPRTPHQHLQADREKAENYQKELT